MCGDGKVRLKRRGADCSRGAAGAVAGGGGGCGCGWQSMFFGIAHSRDQMFKTLRLALVLFTSKLSHLSKLEYR